MRHIHVLKWFIHLYRLKAYVREMSTLTTLLMGYGTFIYTQYTRVLANGHSTEYAVRRVGSATNELPSSYT